MEEAMKRVAIIGAGSTEYKAKTPEVSYREMIFSAAAKAYGDAQITHKEIESFVTCAEDFIEGYSIADEYTPDQLGAVLKPMQTVPGDFIQGVATAYMMIMAGLFKIVAVEAHSKASNIKTPHDVSSFALDPIYNRPLGCSSHFVAGLEMSRYLYESGNNAEHCAAVVVKNRLNAVKNPLAAYGAKLNLNEVAKSEEVSRPLREADISAKADGCIVMVLAEEGTAKSLTKKPVWIDGISWYSDTPGLETRDWGRAVYAELAAKKAYLMAGIENPAKEINVIEVDDEYSYKELQHLEALGFCGRGEAGKLIRDGATLPGGRMPVNLSGGSLGLGHLYEASGAARMYEVVLQLRGEAGERQLAKADAGLAQSWRGVPTTTGAVVIMSNE
jgi:acetyl-CoA C-acetyltransferase